MPRYYGGEGNALGRTQVFQQETFADLVKEVFGHPVPLALTRSQYHALDKEARDRAKRVRFLTAATFPESKQRKTENAAPANLVFLDVDDSAQARTILADGMGVVNQLAPFSFAVYMTASSTPEAPRLRVCVSAESIPFDLYPKAVAYVAQLLGLDQVTPESLVFVQPQYLPVMFRDQADHPLVCCHVDGRDIEANDLDGTVGIATSPRSGVGAEAPGADDFDHLRPPVDEITAEDVREALSHLDPDMDRKPWVAVGAALKHQFQEEGLLLWQEWSAKGSKYPGDDQLETQWKSLRPTPRGRVPVTIRSVLKMALDSGWSSSALLKRCYEATSAWIESPDRSATELMREAVAKIVATPLLSPLEVGSLLNQLQQTLKARGVKVGRSDLTKQFRRAEAETRGRGGDDTSVPDAQLPKWAQGMTYVAQSNEFYRHSTGQRWSVEACNNTFAMHLMTGSEETEGARPAVLPQHYLLNSVRIPRVDYYLYDPTHPNDIHVTYDRKRFINTYRATHPEPDTRRASEAGDLLLTHVNRVVGPGWTGMRLIDWMAYIVQNPGGKVLWAPLLQSAEGAGKTYFAQAMRAVLGESNVKEVSAHSVIHSQWTEWAADCQLVVMEEVRVVGENRHAVMNKLKPLITNRVVSVEQRNRDTRSVPNHANYLLTSNFQDALAITENDRRYFVIYSPVQTKEQVREFGVGYFQRLYESLENNAAGLRAFLLDWPISDEFSPNGPAPETSHKAELVMAAASPLHRAVYQALEDGDSPLVRTDLVSVRALRDVLLAENVGAGRFTDAGLASILREMGYSHSVRVRFGAAERHSIWVPRGTLLSPAEVEAMALAREAGNDFL